MSLQDNKINHKNNEVRSYIRTVVTAKPQNEMRTVNPKKPLNDGFGETVRTMNFYFGARGSHYLSRVTVAKAAQIKVTKRYGVIGLLQHFWEPAVPWQVSNRELGDLSSGCCKNNSECSQLLSALGCDFYMINRSLPRSFKGKPGTFAQGFKRL